MQGSGGEAAVENGLVGAMVEGESGMNGDSSIVIYTRSRVKWIVWCSVVTLRGGMGGEEGGSRGRTYACNYG